MSGGERSVVDEAAVEKAWRARGFSCGHWTDPPEQVWRDYVHAVDELFLVVEGDVELELDGKKLHPKPGEEVLIPAHTLHTVRNTGRAPSHWLYGYKSAA